MNFCESFVETVPSLEIVASYTTSFRCFDGSYALVSGADLTLEYDYGYRQFQVRMPPLSTSIFYSYL